jgi:hypothetical protein
VLNLTIRQRSDFQVATELSSIRNCFRVEIPAEALLSKDHDQPTQTFEIEEVPLKFIYGTMLIPFQSQTAAAKKEWIFRPT